MKNSKKDYPITIGSKLYQFRYNFDALTLIEDLSGKAFISLLSESKLGTWKLVIFAGLKANHPEITLDSVGDLIDEADELGTLIKAVSNAVTSSIGVDKKTEEPAKKKPAPSITQTGA